MTLRTNARVAGITFLLYIVTGIASLIVFNQASGGADAAAKLASIARNEALTRGSAVLILPQFLYALVLAVTLYALTRDQDADLARLAATCRVAEGVIAAMAADQRMELLSVATASTTATGQSAAAARALGSLLLGGGGPPIAAICFVVGSTIYCALFLRSRSIPVALAWLGVVASILLLVALPAQMLGALHRPWTLYAWIPMALFEVVLAVWLIVRGVATPAPRATLVANA